MLSFSYKSKDQCWSSALQDKLRNPIKKTSINMQIYYVELTISSYNKVLLLWYVSASEPQQNQKYIYF